MESMRAVPWTSALVTGASSGIGEALALELARRGVGHLVLVARRADRLQALATDLAQRHDTSVEVLAADLTDPGERARVEQRLDADDDRHPPIDLLVNNAGFGTAGPLVELSPDDEEREIALNVTAVTRLTRAVLPGMIERGRGAILNVSSMASFQPTPGMATYAGTKAFVTLFSESLYEELRGTGVTVTALCPGYVRTEFQSHIPEEGYSSVPDVAWLSLPAVARQAVTAAARGRALCVPGLGYRVVTALEAPLPRGARRVLMGKLSAMAGAVATARQQLAAAAVEPVTDDPGDEEAVPEPPAHAPVVASSGVSHVEDDPG
ncbi:MAG: SDR family oxidoreductase [Acidimicrobiales bacterium]